MAGSIRVVAACARSGKTTHLLAEYRRRISSGLPGVALWLSPTHRAAAAVREQTLHTGLAGCFRPNILTFDQFARRVLEAAGLTIRPIGPVTQRQILGRLVEEALDQKR